MITFEIRVNGSIITAIDVQNVGFQDGDECLYRWRLMRFPLDMAADPEWQRGTLTHQRGEGAEALVGALLQSVVNHSDMTTACNKSNAGKMRRRGNKS